MSVPAAAIQTPIVTPNPGLSFVDQNGNLTNNGRIALQQLRKYIVNMSRIIPCNASTTLNVITLTMLNIQPSVNQYADYETFAFVADATSTGPLTAFVVTENGNLGTIKVFKSNGSAQATTGDITAGLQYLATYSDNLDSGNGGFVLR